MKHSLKVIRALGQANDAQAQMPETPEREVFEAALSAAVAASHKLAATEGVTLDERYDAFVGSPGPA